MFVLYRTYNFDEYLSSGFVFRTYILHGTILCTTWGAICVLHSNANCLTGSWDHIALQVKYILFVQQASHTMIQFKLDNLAINHFSVHGEQRFM